VRSTIDARLFAPGARVSTSSTPSREQIDTLRSMIGPPIDDQRPHVIDDRTLDQR
jgi:hypothetical protein